MENLENMSLVEQFIADKMKKGLILTATCLSLAILNGHLFDFINI